MDVDLVVAPPDGERRVEVAAGIGVEHFLELLLGQLGKVFDAVHQLLRLQLAADGDDALGGVLGEIADPLEVVGDVDRRHDLAEILSHRLAAGDGEDRLLLDLALHDVDLAVVLDDLLGEVGVDAGTGPAPRGRPHVRPCRRSR